MMPARLALPSVVVCAAVAIASIAQAAEPLQIDAEFPGGNILVDKIDNDRVSLRPDLRDTAGSWFYWCFRVRGAAGRSVTFAFNADVIGVRGPAISTDDGQTWSWLGAAHAHGSSFVHTFPPNSAAVRFAFAIPYTQANWQAFLHRVQGPSVRVDRLCRTSKGRDVPLLRVGCLDCEPDARVLLTARHHACESLASYALEGLLEVVVRSNDDLAWLREHVDFLAIPFMDTDGVEDGDQGKNRQPHDHNRDYAERRHPSVRALTEFVPDWSQGKIRVAIDLHCPWIRGPHNEVIYFVGMPNQTIWRETIRFSTILENGRQGALPFHAADNLPFGQAWNTGTGDPHLQKFEQWAERLPGIRLAASAEIPYANASGSEVNADSARAFGADLARALQQYLSISGL